MSHFENFSGGYKENIRNRSKKTHNEDINSEENQVQFIPIQLKNESQPCTGSRTFSDTSRAVSRHSYSTAQLKAIEKFNELFKKIVVLPSENNLSNNISEQRTECERPSFFEEPSPKSSSSLCGENFDFQHGFKEIQTSEESLSGSSTTEVQTEQDEEYAQKFPNFYFPEEKENLKLNENVKFDLGSRNDTRLHQKYGGGVSKRNIREKRISLGEILEEVGTAEASANYKSSYEEMIKQSNKFCSNPWEKDMCKRKGQTYETTKGIYICNGNNKCMKNGNSTSDSEQSGISSPSFSDFKRISSPLSMMNDDESKSYNQCNTENTRYSVSASNNLEIEEFYEENLENFISAQKTESNENKPVKSIFSMNITKSLVVENSSLNVIMDILTISEQKILKNVLSKDGRISSRENNIRDTKSKPIENSVYKTTRQQCLETSERKKESRRKLLRKYEKRRFRQLKKARKHLNNGSDSVEDSKESSSNHENTFKGVIKKSSRYDALSCDRDSSTPSDIGNKIIKNKGRVPNRADSFFFENEYGRYQNCEKQLQKRKLEGPYRNYPLIYQSTVEKTGEIPEQVVETEEIPEQNVETVEIPEQVVETAEIQEQNDETVGIPEQVVETAEIQEQNVETVEIPEQVVETAEIQEQNDGTVEIPEQLVVTFQEPVKPKRSYKEKFKKIFKWLEKIGIKPHLVHTNEGHLGEAEENLKKQRNVLKSKLRYPKEQTSRLYLHRQEYIQIQDGLEQLKKGRLLPVLKEIRCSQIIEPNYAELLEAFMEDKSNQSTEVEDKVPSEDSTTLFERGLLYERLQQYGKYAYRINMYEDDEFDHVSIRSADQKVECGDKPFLAAYNFGADDLRVHVTKDTFGERDQGELFKGEKFMECKNSKIKLSLLRGKKYLDTLDPNKARIIELDCAHRFSQIKICYKKKKNKRDCICEGSDVCKSIQLESTDLSSVDIDREDKASGVCGDCEYCLEARMRFERENTEKESEEEEDSGTCGNCEVCLERRRQSERGNTRKDSEEVVDPGNCGNCEYCLERRMRSQRENTKKESEEVVDPGTCGNCEVCLERRMQSERGNTKKESEEVEDSRICGNCEVCSERRRQSERGNTMKDSEEVADAGTCGNCEVCLGRRMQSERGNTKKESKEVVNTVQFCQMGPQTWIPNQGFYDESDPYESHSYQNVSSRKTKRNLSSKRRKYLKSRIKGP